ncbi:MAG: DUF4440 domain-containing protein [Candidatus Rokubacteria bacterium]|nr:DUF4440 domain-containing protein [Candidatus Rokubacteria bacterium]
MAKKATKTVAKRSVKKAPAKTAPKGPSAAEAIHKLGLAFMKGVSTKNSQALVSAFYAPDAVLMPPNQPALEGRQNIRLALQGMMDAGVTSLKLETIATGSSGDLAWERARYTLSMTPPDGAPVQDTGKSLVVYKRQPNGQWLAIVDMYSSDQPA